MENIIEEKLRGKTLSEVVDLSIDYSTDTEIVGFDVELPNLKKLSISFGNLESLAGLPFLPSLEYISLEENNLSEGFDVLAKQCPGLVQINLINNPIEDIKVLEPLNELKKLVLLDLCDIDCNEARFSRASVFEILPNLKYLDGFDINNKEAEKKSGDTSFEDDDEGEDEEIEDEGEDEDGGDEGNLGTAYLDSSRAAREEDNSEDYVEEKKSDPKRKHEAGDQGEPSKKKPC